jgi:hypothetical protein
MFKGWGYFVYTLQDSISNIYLQLEFSVYQNKEKSVYFEILNDLLDNTELYVLWIC